MDPVAALNTRVKRELADTFGMAMASMIILQCSQSAEVSTTEMEAAGYRKLIAAIAFDPRVTQMFGQAGADSKKEMWLGLVEG